MNLTALKLVIISTLWRIVVLFTVLFVAIPAFAQDGASQFNIDPSVVYIGMIALCIALVYLLKSLLTALAESAPPDVAQSYKDMQAQFAHELGSLARQFANDFTEHAKATEQKSDDLIAGVVETVVDSIIPESDTEAES